MRLFDRLRAFRVRRRETAAERLDDQGKLRREIEADDKSMVEAVHPPAGPPFGLGPF